MQPKKHIDDNLADLYVISLLPEGVKISIKNGRIIHEKPKGGDGFMSSVSNIMHGMKRWMNSDNRTSGINEIYTIVQRSFMNVNELLEEKYQSYLTRYDRLYPDVVTGIENYKRTYSDDAYIVSRCNVIIGNIQTFLVHS
jgi:hypothetical protein